MIVHVYTCTSSVVKLPSPLSVVEVCIVTCFHVVWGGNTGVYNCRSYTCTGTCDSRRVEIEGYFVTYFDPIAGLEGLIRPLCELVRCLYSYETCMSPALNN